jgi:hypothetical protein
LITTAIPYGLSPGASRRGYRIAGDGRGAGDVWLGLVMIVEQDRVEPFAFSVLGEQQILQTT